MSKRAADPPPGLNAWFNGTCYECDEPIVRNESRIVAKEGQWRHCHCAPGADDE